MANYQRALRVAIDEHVDLVVHGGDVFHRPNVPASLVHQAFEPLEDVAAAGIPVFVVPGNHERSRIPYQRLARRAGVHVFTEPGTVGLAVAGTAVAVSGFPCIRRDARTGFRDALRRCRWPGVDAQLRFLVVHQAFEGAVVGPADFTFRRGRDVVELADVPAEFAAVLAGHIHRTQVLERDLAGRRSATPVFYPGSLERTAFAERAEPKGFMLLHAMPDSAGGAVSRWAFRDLDARPMEIRPLRVQGLTAAALERELRSVLAAVPPDAVLRLEADGPPARDANAVLAAERVRRLAPKTMNVEIVVPGARRWTGRPRDRGSGSGGGGITAGPGGIRSRDTVLVWSRRRRAASSRSGE